MYFIVLRFVLKLMDVLGKSSNIAKAHDYLHVSDYGRHAGSDKRSKMLNFTNILGDFGTPLCIRPQVICGARWDRRVGRLSLTAFGVGGHIARNFLAIGHAEA